MIYFDNAATTPVAQRVLKEILPYFDYNFGNPGSIYKLGRDANEAVQQARTRVAEFFRCDPAQVIFTSGGSEGNTTVFCGCAKRLMEEGKTHILVSETEHDSVLRAAKSLENTPWMFDVETIPVGPDGIVSVSVLKKLIREETGLVSVMYVNNETGAVNSVEEIGELCTRNGILFHTDCVQAAGVLPLNVNLMACDFATISGHKLRAPKGVGALYVRGKKLMPLVYGGYAQESGLRGGTENVPGIVGLGLACSMISENFEKEIQGISAVKQVFYAWLLEEFEARGISTDIIHINGAHPVSKGKILNLRFDGVDAQTLILMLDAKGVCVSAGSACTSKETSASHVLLAMGLSEEEARTAVRFSFGSQNTTDDAVEAAKIIADCVSAILEVGIIA